MLRMMRSTVLDNPDLIKDSLLATLLGLSTISQHSGQIYLSSIIVRANHQDPRMPLISGRCLVLDIAYTH